MRIEGSKELRYLLGVDLRKWVAIDGIKKKETGFKSERRMKISVLTLLSFQYSKNIEVLLGIAIHLEKGED